MPPNPHLNREGLFVCFRRYVIHIKTLAPGDHNHLRVLVAFCKGKRTDFACIQWKPTYIRRS